MKRVIQIAILVATLAMIIGGVESRAEMTLASDQLTTVFKADGKVVSPTDAAKLSATREIKKCTPIKGATDTSEHEQLVYKCKVVVFEFNPRTGVPHWKTK